MAIEAVKVKAYVNMLLAFFCTELDTLKSTSSFVKLFLDCSKTSVELSFDNVSLGFSRGVTYCVTMVTAGIRPSDLKRCLMCGLIDGQ